MRMLVKVCARMQLACAYKPVHVHAYQCPEILIQIFSLFFHMLYLCFDSFLFFYFIYIYRYKSLLYLYCLFAFHMIKLGFIFYFFVLMHEHAFTCSCINAIGAER